MLFVLHASLLFVNIVFSVSLNIIIRVYLFRARIIDCVKRPCSSLGPAAYDAVISSNCEGRSINTLQNGAISSVFKIGKIRNIRFVGNLILNIRTTFLDDYVIIVTSSDNRTQSICVLFSPPVYYRNSQVLNSIENNTQIDCVLLSDDVTIMT